MPVILIWNIAALPWIAPVARWVSEFDVAGRLLEKWLKRQLATAERIDRLTASFPVFRFYNMAVCAEISRLQFNAIAPAPDSQFDAQMRRVGAAWNLPDVVSRRITEGLLISNVIGIIETITREIIDSIDRLATPRASMFDPDNARVTDLFGLAALLFNTVANNRAGILAAGQGLANGLRLSPGTSERSPAASVSVAGSGTPPDMATSVLAMARDFAAQAETVLQYIAAGLLILPAIGGLVLAMGQDVVLVLRQKVLDFIISKEQAIHRWRRSFYERLYRALHGWLDGTVLFMLAVRDVAFDHVRYGVEFGLAYIDALADGIQVFARQLQGLWAGVGSLISAMVDYLDRVMQVDIGEVLHRAMVLFERIIDFIGDNLSNDPDKAPRYRPPAQMVVSIGDFATGTGTGATARDQLATAGSTLQASFQQANMFSVAANMWLGSTASGMFLPGMAAGTIRLTQMLRTPMAPVRAQPTLTFDPGTVPDLTARIVEPARAGLISAVDGLGASLQTGIGNIAGGFGALADDMAMHAEQSALDAVRLGSLGHYHRIVEGSEALVGRAFPDMPAATPTGLEAVGRAYGLWLAGAFEILGGLMGGFLSMLVDEWRARIDSNSDATFEATPTSPRKLLARARLGVVRVPELRIVMNGPDTDQAAANDVADAFKRAVGDMYMTGIRRLDDYRARAASTAI